MPLSKFILRCTLINKHKQLYPGLVGKTEWNRSTLAYFCTHCWLVDRSRRKTAHSPGHHLKYYVTNCNYTTYCDIETVFKSIKWHRTNWKLVGGGGVVGTTATSHDAATMLLLCSFWRGHNKRRSLYTLCVAFRVHWMFWYYPNSIRHSCSWFGHVNVTVATLTHVLMCACATNNRLNATVETNEAGWEFSLITYSYRHHGRRYSNSSHHSAARTIIGNTICI